MTKKEMFVVIREAMAENAEVVAFCDHEIELLDKRNSYKSSKPTKAQLEREAQYARLIEFLGENPKATCAAVADEMGVTLHSATGMLTQLRKRGQVMREYEGKTPVYSLGSEAEVEGE